MPTGSMDRLVQHLCRAALLQAEVVVSDGQLLERYLTRRDETAFSALVQRHGPMVLGVCRRVLRNEADAEDAFQATFLVLVRTGASIRARGALGGWLYGVAHNTALKARALDRRRRAREREAGVAVGEEAPDATGEEARALLEAHLSQLPAPYRAAIVLCDLEGRTIRDAAAHLGWPPGTVATRLRRGRTMLARRLSGRGLALAVGVTALSEGLASAGVPVPAALAQSTAKSAALLAAGAAIPPGLVPARVTALAEGVLQAMFLRKLKTAAVAAFLFAVLGLVGGSLYRQVRAADPSPPPQSGKQGAGKGDEDGVRNTLLALDEHLWEASARGDWQERQKFLAEDMVSISVLGKYAKADNTEADKRVRCADWKIRDAEVVRVGPDVAVLTYLYGCKVLSRTGELLETRNDFRVSYVWANRQGGWVIVFCHDDHGRR